MSARELSEAQPSVERRTQAVWILTALFVVLVLDQITKAIITYYIPLGSRTFAGREQEFFFFTHQRNDGLVGGMGSGIPYLPYVAPLLASLVLVYLFFHLHPGSRLQSLAYGMIGGGALGNLLDRFFREGGVVDFLQFHFVFIPFEFPWKRYPAFNVADSAICIGVVLLLVSWHRLEKARVSDPD